MARREVDAGIELDALIAPRYLLAGRLPEYEFAETRHQAKGLCLRQKLEWADEAMFGVVPANQRLGFAGQPLAARIPLDLWLVTQHELAAVDRILDLLPGKLEHPPPAATGRGGQLVEIEFGADPFDIVDIGEFVGELRAIAAAQGLAVCRDDNAEGRTVAGVLQGPQDLNSDVLFGQHDDAAGLPTHEIRERCRAGEVAGRKTHLPNDIVQRPISPDSFTRN